MKIKLTLNGKATTADVPANHLLSDFLRDHMRLTGTHVGCDTSQCGACTILLDGKPVKSCSLLVVQVDGCAITTIEGLADGDRLHPMQQAFKDHHGLQCGYCTPGMVMTALGIVDRHGLRLDEDLIARELDGNLCRCTGYRNIIKAVKAGAEAMNEGK